MIFLNLIIDCRETALIEQCTHALPHYQRQLAAAKVALTIAVRSLTLGDVLLERVSVAGGADDHADDAGPSSVTTPLLLIERKTVSDLMASITDGRYAEQSFRLARHPEIQPHNVVYLLEGSIAALRRPQDADKRQRCLSALTSCQFFKGFSTCRTESIDDTVHYLLATAAKIGAGLAQGKTPAVTTTTTTTTASDTATAAAPSSSASYASVVPTVKKANLTAANIGVVFLSQIPGFSATSAQCVMDSATDLRHLLEVLGSKEGRDRLRALEIHHNHRRLGDAAVARLCAFLRPDLEGAAEKDKAAAAAASKKKKKRPRCEEEEEKEEEEEATKR